MKNLAEILGLKLTSEELKLTVDKKIFEFGKIGKGGIVFPKRKISYGIIENGDIIKVEEKFAFTNNYEDSLTTYNPKKIIEYFNPNGILLYKTIEKNKKYYFKGDSYLNTKTSVWSFGPLGSIFGKKIK